MTVWSPDRRLLDHHRKVQSQISYNWKTQCSSGGFLIDSKFRLKRVDSSGKKTFNNLIIKLFAEAIKSKFVASPRAQKENFSPSQGKRGKNLFNSITQWMAGKLLWHERSCEKGFFVKDLLRSCWRSEKYFQRLKKLRWKNENGIHKYKCFVYIFSPLFFILGNAYGIFQVWEFSTSDWT